MSNGFAQVFQHGLDLIEGCQIPTRHHAQGCSTRARSAAGNGAVNVINVPRLQVARNVSHGGRVYGTEIHND